MEKNKPKKEYVMVRLTKAMHTFLVKQQEFPDRNISDTIFRLMKTQKKGGNFQNK